MHTVYTSDQNRNFQKCLFAGYPVDISKPLPKNLGFKKTRLIEVPTVLPDGTIINFKRLIVEYEKDLPIDGLKNHLKFESLKQEVEELKNNKDINSDLCRD